MAIPYSGGNYTFSSAYLGAFADLENDYNLPISSNPLSTFEKTQLNNSLSLAQATGDKKWERVIQYVLKYGGAVVGILASAGILKNKNLESVITGDINSDKADEFAQIGKDYTNRNANDGSGSGSGSIKVLGIEINATTLLIAIVILILLYNMFQQSNNNKKK